MPTSLSNRLAQLRNQRRMSKSEFARKVGVSPTCVWNWEQGNTSPRADNLEGIALALGVTTSYLLDNEQTGKVMVELPETNDRFTTNIRTENWTALSLAETIDIAKEKIAQAAGLPIHRVKITLDY